VRRTQAFSCSGPSGVPAYVDDTCVVGYPLPVEAAKQAMLAIFPGKDFGEVLKHVRWHITRDRKLRTLTIDQAHYARELIGRQGETDAKPVSTPLPYKGDLPKRATSSDPSVERKCREIVGSVSRC
jgi:hypothetical protein